MNHWQMSLSSLTTLAVLACVAPSAFTQDVSVTLTHDAAGPVEPLEPVRFSFTIEYPADEGYIAVRSFESALRVSPTPLAGFTRIDFQDFIASGGRDFNDSKPVKAGGFREIRFSNYVSSSTILTTAILGTPLVFGTFDVVPLCEGTLRYRFEPFNIFYADRFTHLINSEFVVASVPFDKATTSVQPLEVARSLDSPIAMRFSPEAGPEPVPYGSAFIMDAIGLSSGDLVVFGFISQSRDDDHDLKILRLQNENWVALDIPDIDWLVSFAEMPNGDLVIAKHIEGNDVLYTEVLRLDASSFTVVDRLFFAGQTEDLVVTPDGTVWVFGEDFSLDLTDPNPEVTDLGSAVQWSGGDEAKLVDLPGNVFNIRHALALPSGELYVTGDAQQPLSQVLLYFDGQAWSKVSGLHQIAKGGLFLEVDGSVLMNSGADVYRFREGAQSLIDYGDLFGDVNVVATLPDGTYFADIGDKYPFYSVDTFFRGLTRFRDDQPIAYSFGSATDLDYDDIYGILTLADDSILAYGGFQTAAGRPARGLTAIEFTDTQLCCLPIDMNADAIIDTLDISVMVQRFLVGAEEADLNNDGVLDHGDLHVFIDLYLNGCGD